MDLFNRFHNQKRDEKEEKSLINKAKRGDIEAFGLIYEHHMARMYRFIRLKVDTKEDAEDLTHHTFLKAWGHLHSYEEQETPFSAWLYRIARNTIIDFYRTKKQTVELTEQAIASLPLPPQTNDLSISLQEIRKHFASLPGIEQDALCLRYIEDMSHKDIANIIQKSEGATKVLIHRALIKIKQQIQSS